MGISGVVGVGADIDILGFQLGVQDRLTVVKTAVTGKHIADAAGQRKIQQTLGAKQLHPVCVVVSALVSNSTNEAAVAS